MQTENCVYNKQFVVKPDHFNLIDGTKMLDEEKTPESFLWTSTCMHKINVKTNKTEQ